MDGAIVPVSKPAAMAYTNGRISKLYRIQLNVVY